MRGRSADVAVVFPAVTVVVNYATGRTHLRPHGPRGPRVPSGVTVIVHNAHTPSWGTVEIPARLVPALSAPLAWRVAAVPALLVTGVVAVAGRSGGRFRRLVRLASLGRALPPAGPVEVRNALRAVRWASRVVPARWACLEQTVSTAVLLAAVGRRAEWRHGVVTDPVRLHAWVQDATGKPVEEPADTSLYVVTHTPDGPGPEREGPERSSP